MIDTEKLYRAYRGWLRAEIRRIGDTWTWDDDNPNLKLLMKRYERRDEIMAGSTGYQLDFRPHDQWVLVIGEEEMAFDTRGVERMIRLWEAGEFEY